MAATPAAAQSVGLCEGYGPQSPRDIAAPGGTNPVVTAPAPPPTQMNLCNIHVHAPAEHKGPGYSVPNPNGGYDCDGANALSAAERQDPADGRGAFYGAVPGDTIEVHWVYTSCTVTPGMGLSACVSDQCANPQLRVEAQVFLLVNDPAAADFASFIYRGRAAGHEQPRSLPDTTGEPVVYSGSTTGPTYDESKCSPLSVTWSVRPNCARLDVSSLNAWAQAGNVFNEYRVHGVRRLVVSPELLAPIGARPSN
ncbi:cadmium carbonic anhydrase [Acuticoccus sp. 2012]|uniref:Cadmium carbonic anhydrase n=2 Tax=Acuticoccus mangrovi TaxID=2796142 RepID=A0A934IM97_9HYPH|nr:cadmium carbonic anhydrase [Acuticoccus mangrovi]